MFSIRMESEHTIQNIHNSDFHAWFCYARQPNIHIDLKPSMSSKIISFRQSVSVSFLLVSNNFKTESFLSKSNSTCVSSVLINYEYDFNNATAIFQNSLKLSK